MTTLKAQAVQGIRWTTINTAAMTGIQFVQLAILGRILGPEAYGLMAMVTIVTGFAQVFADIGLSSAIIQRKAPTGDELSTLFWVNVLFGIMLYALLSAAAPIAARGFSEQAVTGLLQVAGLSFIISPFGIQINTLLRKNLRFDIISKLNVGSALFGLGIAIACALSGYGVWSLIFGALGRATFRTALLVLYGHAAGWLPAMHFRWSDTRGYISFGLYRVGAMTVNYFNSRIDQILIGSLMGPVSLGYYNIAFRLVIEPVQKLNPILTSVAFPVFSIMQEDTARLKKAFLKMISLLASVNAPILIGFAAVAPSAVPFLVGNQWLPAVPVIQVLAWYALIRSLGNAGGGLIIAKGKAHWSFYWNCALFFIIPPAVYVAGHSGDILNICYTLVLLQAALFLCHYRIIIYNLLGPCFTRYGLGIARPVLSAAAMSAIILAGGLALKTQTGFVTLALQLCAGGCIYCGLTWVFNKDFFLELALLLPVRWTARYK